MAEPNDRPLEPDSNLVPPKRLLFDGTSSQEEFKTHGRSFVDYFLIDRAGLKADDRVLDVGSGIGQKARALAGYLTPSGSYEGLEIVAQGVTWCTEHYKPYPNFRFSHADLYSSHYNPSGSIQASDFEFPYPSGDFDLVLLSSVFTHMLPEGMIQYFGEIERVLRPAGKVVVTFFLLNDHSREHLRRNRAKPGGWNLKESFVNTPHRYESDLCYVADLSHPETIVAHDEPRVRELCRQHGFEITGVTYGNWCGRQHSALQDVIIAVKDV